MTPVIFSGVQHFVAKMLTKWCFAYTVPQSLIKWPLSRSYFGSWDEF